MTARQTPDAARPAHDPNWRKRPRWWTPDRLFTLADLIERGLTDAQIAAELETTADAVQLARKRHGIQPRSAHLLSCRAVADLLGIGCSKKIRHLIRLKWLRGRRGQQWGPHRQWYIRREDVLAFLEHSDYWHVWSPEHITDSIIREWAIEMRVGVRFLTPGQVAWRMCVGVGAVNDWIHRGWLPARKWGNWWVLESDLDRFELPRIGGRRKQAATADELTVGSRVRVKRGPFSGMSGTIIDVGQDGIATVVLVSWGVPVLFWIAALEAA